MEKFLFNFDSEIFHENNNFTPMKQGFVFIVVAEWFPIFRALKKLKYMNGTS